MRNVYIAYALWFFCGTFGLHRIYCKKFVSGFFMMFLFWFGSLTTIFLFGWLILGIYGIWWIIDVFLTNSWVDQINANYEKTNQQNYNMRMKNLDELYQLYEKGAISKQEFYTRKDIIMNQ